MRNRLLYYTPQVEEFADKQKELESTIQPIMTRLYQGACSNSDPLVTCA
jgi:hypothetical protein